MAKRKTVSHACDGRTACRPRISRRMRRAALPLTHATAGCFLNVERDVWYEGAYVNALASQTPPWNARRCAAACHADDRCNFWTVQLQKRRECQLFSSRSLCRHVAPAFTHVSGACRRGTDAILSPSPPPPPMPPLPPWAPPVDVTAQINARMRRGHLSSDLHEAGVLLHQFDNIDSHVAEDFHTLLMRPLPRPQMMESKHPAGFREWNLKFRDRLSATLLHVHMKRDHVGKRYGVYRSGATGMLPLFSYTAAGIVLRPSVARVMCSYSYDAGTTHRECTQLEDSNAPSPRVGCVPGCTPRGSKHAVWCNVRPAELCAWPPHELQGMMREWTLRRDRQQSNWGTGRYWNELVLNTTALGMTLPVAIEAFFFLNNVTCDDHNICVMAGATKCEHYARIARAAMLAHFRLRSAAVPLLMLNARTGHFTCVDGCR